MGNPNINKYSKPFTKDNQPSKEALAKRVKNRSENTRKRRELAELLNLSLKGNAEKDINEVLMEEMGISAATLEEALHFVQIAKALSQKDTAAYMALMNVSGLVKPTKVAQTDKDGNDVQLITKVEIVQPKEEE